MAHEAEALTRISRVDPKLRASGWKPVPPTTLAKAIGLRASAVRELATMAGPADYALCDDGAVLGVVEAKKVGLGPQEVLVQAERYSKGIPQEPRYRDGYGVPFLYASRDLQSEDLDAIAALGLKLRRPEFTSAMCTAS